MKNPRLNLIVFFLLGFGLVSRGDGINTKTHEKSVGTEIKVHETVIFDGYKGWIDNGLTYRLACGAIITQCHNNDLLAYWLSGTDKEPATDNCALISRSLDSGKTWSKPQVLVHAANGVPALASNIYPLDDGRMAAFWAYVPAEKEYTTWNYHRMYSSDNGRSWSTPQSFRIDNDKASLFEGKPLKLANGEYLFAGTFFIDRPKPLVAPVTELLKAGNESEAAAMPAGKGKTSGVFGKHLHGCICFISKHQDGTGMIAGGQVANRPLGLLEPTCLQLKDGRIVMLMRAQFGGKLWRSESFDNGRTWKDAWETDILNPSSMAHLVRLPDQRIVLINNNSSKDRNPLSIWISNDEMQSWYIRQDVIFGRKLAYPHGIILKNGSLAFVYDNDRRQVRFVKVELPSKEE